MRWKLDYLDGHRQTNYGIHLDFGTAIHAGIEVYKTRKNPVTVEEAVEVFRWTFCLLYGENSQMYSEGDRKQDPNFFLEAGTNILRRFDECEELASAQVLYNEHELKVPIDRSDDIKIYFKGYIDMVIKTVDGRGTTVLYILDFKSCSWGWSREQREDSDKHAQVFLYKHFLCKKFNIDPKNVRCAFVLLKKRPRKGDTPVELFKVSAGPVSVQRALDSLNSDLTEMNRRIQSGKFDLNTNECVNRYGQRCPYLETDLCPSSKRTTR